MAACIPSHSQGVEAKENYSFCDSTSLSPLTPLAVGLQLYPWSQNGFKGFHFLGMTKAGLWDRFSQVAC